MVITPFSLMYHKKITIARKKITPQGKKVLDKLPYGVYYREKLPHGVNVGDDMLNLRRILDAKGIPPKACAGFLDITEKTLYNKTIGASEFTYSESRRLKVLLPEYDIDFLLSEDTSNTVQRPTES